MINRNTFRVTFHVHHPTISSDEIIDAIGLNPHFSQSIGLERKTRTGISLGGNYDSTNVSFRLHAEPLGFDCNELDDVIIEFLKSVSPDFFSGIVNTGGELHFLLGIYSSDNVMFELTDSLFNYLTLYNIKLKFDFYGGDD